MNGNKNRMERSHARFLHKDKYKYKDIKWDPIYFYRILII